MLNARIELATFSLRGRCSTNWANSANQPHNTRIIPKLAPVGKKMLGDELTNFNQQILNFFLADLSIFFNKSDKTINI